MEVTQWSRTRIESSRETLNVPRSNGAKSAESAAGFLLDVSDDADHQMRWGRERCRLDGRNKDRLVEPHLLKLIK